MAKSTLMFVVRLNVEVDEQEPDAVLPGEPLGKSYTVKQVVVNGKEVPAQLVPHPITMFTIFVDEANAFLITLEADSY